MRFPAKALTGLGILALLATLSACGNGNGKADESASLTLQTYTARGSRGQVFGLCFLIIPLTVV